MRGKNKIKQPQRYYTFSDYCKKVFNKKVYKLSLDGGFTCPNRDGTVGNLGCIFCSEGGSGDFAESITCGIDLAIEKAKERVSKKIHEDNPAYIAYFQSYSNTYASADYLEKLYTPILQRDDIVAISLATRPDCLPNETLELIKKLNKIKPVFIELGLQTIHNSTAEFIRRGYPLETFNDAVNKLKKTGAQIVVHLILGLPNESEEMILQTVNHVVKLKVDGVKFHLLHVLKNTDLATYYLQNKFTTLSKEEYINLLAKCIEALSPNTVVHRITGDAPKKLLIAPLWSANKKDVLNSINKYFNERNILQGKNYKES